MESRVPLPLKAPLFNQFILLIFQIIVSMEMEMNYVATEVEIVEVEIEREIAATTTDPNVPDQGEPF